MSLNFENLTPEMAVKLLDNKELLTEFCSLVKKLDKRVAELERTNMKLVHFVMLQSQYNQEQERQKEIKKNVPRKVSSTPRKSRELPSSDSFDSFGWKDDSFSSF